MATFIPDLYKRLGTTVSIDLGSLGDLGAIRDGVNSLTTQFSAVPVQFGALQSAISTQIGTAQTSITAQVNAQVTTTADRLAEQLHDEATGLGQQLDGVHSATSTTLLELQHERRLQRERHDKVMDLLQTLGESSPRQLPAELNPKCGPVVRALNTCQALVLSTASGQALAEARDQAAKLLQGQEDWLQRLAEATERRVTAWDERSQHYWALQRLIEDVAVAWQQQQVPPTPPTPNAPQTGETEVQSTATA
jgi:hypothetical protein